MFSTTRWLSIGGLITNFSPEKITPARNTVMVGNEAFETNPASEM